MFNGEKLWRALKLTSLSFTPVNNGLELVLDTDCHFDLIELLSFIIETGVNGCAISVDNKLRADANAKVINKNLKQSRTWEFTLVFSKQIIFISCVWIYLHRIEFLIFVLPFLNWKHSWKLLCRSLHQNKETVWKQRFSSQWNKYLIFLRKSRYFIQNVSQICSVNS